MFGKSHLTRSTEQYPADEVPVFPLLDGKTLGKQEWRLREDKGAIDGGDWAVRIFDADLGQDWQHSPNDTDWRGLDGLHRVVRFNDANLGWGTLDAYLLRNEAGSVPLTLDIVEKSPKTLWNRIAALGASEWIPLWVNHECFAIDGKSGTFPNYTLNIADTDTSLQARGLYRSRIANHLSDVHSIVNPFITDAPPSIEGGYAFLWAVPINNSGEFYESSADVPILSQEREGVVKPTSVKTKKGVTSVSVSSPFKALKKDISTHAPERTRLARYVFTRGESGTTAASIANNYQCPHLVIYECDWKTVYDEALADSWSYERYANRDANWTSYPVWLCDQDSVVTFDTAQEVMQALETELDKLSATAGSAHSNSQKTGDEAPGNPNGRITLKNTYWITAGELRTQIRYDGDPEHEVAQTCQDDKARHAVSSWITGPLAWLFHLGHEEQAFPNHENYRNIMRAPHGTYPGIAPNWYDYAAGKMISGSNGNPFQGNISNPDPWLRALPAWSGKAGILAPQSKDLAALAFVKAPEFVLQYDWTNREVDIDDWVIPGPLSATPVPPPVGEAAFWRIPLDPDVNKRVVWLSQGSNVDGFYGGDSLSIGGQPDKRYPNLTQDITSTDDGSSAAPYYPYIELVQTYFDVSDIDKSKQTAIGETLYYCPWSDAFGLAKDAGGNVLDQVAWDPDNFDHWLYDPAQVQSNAHIFVQPKLNQELSMLFNGLLGSPSADAIDVPYRMQLSDVPFFHRSDDSDWDDFTSIIDWDSMDNSFVTVFHSHRYLLPISDESVSFWDALTGETLFHSCQWQQYYDDTNLLWRWRFVPMSKALVSDAWVAGSNLNANEEHLARATVFTEQHSDRPQYNKLIINASRSAKDGKYRLTLTVVDENPRAVTLADRGELTINSVLSNIPGILRNKNYDKITSELYGTFADGLLRKLSMARVTQGVSTISYPRLQLGVGQSLLLTAQAAHAPYTHVLGVTEEPIRIIKSGFDISTQKCSIMFEYSGQDLTYNIAPACAVPASQSTKDGWPSPGTITITGASAHAFSLGAEDPSDYMLFDCWTWPTSKLTDASAVARSCSCGDYSIIAFEDGDTDPTLMNFTVSVAQDGTMTLTPAAQADYDAWVEANSHVLIFDTWDNVEACQQRWLYACDADGGLGAADDIGHRCL
jgi:hypothetical protein